MKTPARAAARTTAAAWSAVATGDRAGEGAQVLVDVAGVGDLDALVGRGLQGLGDQPVLAAAAPVDGGLVHPCLLYSSTKLQAGLEQWLTALKAGGERR